MTMIQNRNASIRIEQAPHEYRVVEEADAVTDEERNICKVVLSKEQEREFSRRYKIGVLKQLHKKNMLTDEQLYALIKMQK